MTEPGGQSGRPSSIAPRLSPSTVTNVKCGTGASGAEGLSVGAADGADAVALITRESASRERARGVGVREARFTVQREPATRPRHPGRARRGLGAATTSRDEGADRSCDAGWSQTRLAAELAEIGYPKSRPTLTKLEGGQYRNVSVDDLFALAAALGVPPVHLLTPLEDDAPVAITPTVSHPAALARKWIRGLVSLPMLPGVDLTQIPESELFVMVLGSLTRGWTPLLVNLKAAELEAEARRTVAAIRNPEQEGENDGKRG
jgi:transcriptional regulator with XRE-family HTH domain